MNRDIIQSFEQLKDIFPEITAFPNDNYFLYLNFGFNIDCIFQITKIDEDVLGLCVHCYKEQSVFLNFVKWFYWIFAVTD